MQTPTQQDIDKIRDSGFRPEVVGCFINDKRLLFVYKKDHDLWQLPQGGIENGESPEDSVSREMKEELGARFFDAASKEYQLIGEDELEFPENVRKGKTLIDSTWQEIEMKGKKYFFYEISTTEELLDIDDTEFDDYRWVDYAGALELTREIYQKGKRSITLNAIKNLKSLDLI